jgi:hypothetical protein
MSAVELLEKLIEIERAIGVEEPRKIREMVMQAEEYLLEIQKNAARSAPNRNAFPPLLLCSVSCESAGKADSRREW